MSDGNSVTTPLVNISARIVSVFSGEDDRFDKSRRQVKLRVLPGTRLHDAEDTITTEKVQAKERACRYCFTTKTTPPKAKTRWLPPAVVHA